MPVRVLIACGMLSCFAAEGAASPQGLSSLNPSSVAAGGGAFILTVNGSDFVSASLVQWNGIALSTSFTSSTQLRASVPASMIAIAGAYFVRVVNPGGNFAAIYIIDVAPVLKSIAPEQASAGTLVTVTLTGLGFGSGCNVEVQSWGRMTSTFVSSTTLTALLPPAALGPPGNRASVFVVCASSPSKSLPLESKGPTISSISPNSAPANSRDLTVTVDGSFFVPGALISWNGNPPSLATDFVSSTRLTTTIPAALLAVPRTNTFTVQNTGGYASNGVPFTVGPPQLSLFSVTPNTTIATGPPFLMTLTGSGFTRDAVVEVSGEALSTTFVSGTELIAGALAKMIATPGTLAVYVRIGSNVSNSLPVSVSGAPFTSLGMVTNLAGGRAIAPGSLISIYGYNLAPAAAIADGLPAPTALNRTSVRINGAPIPLLYVSPGQINAQMPYEALLGVVDMEIQAGTLTGRSNAIIYATGPGVWHLPNSSQVIGINIPEGSLNGADHPIRPGQFVTLFLTGQGKVTNPVPTGAAAPESPFSIPLAPVAVKIAGVTAKVMFAGLAPGYIGLLQLNVEIPEVAAGEQPLEITIGEQLANPTTISIGAKIG